MTHEGCPRGVIVITDHKLLTLLMDQQELSWLQTRWIQLGLFQSIQPKFQYLPGKANIIANALSKSRPHQEEDQEEGSSRTESQDQDQANVVQATKIALAKEQISLVKEV